MTDTERSVFAQSALERLIEGYVPSNQVWARVHILNERGHGVSGWESLEQMDEWQNVGGLLKRGFYIRQMNDQEEDEFRLHYAYVGEFEGHPGWQVLLVDDNDNELQMLPIPNEPLPYSQSTGPNPDLDL